MNCPKCGRELDIDFTAEGSLSVICGNCCTVIVIRPEPIKQPELTTAKENKDMKCPKCGSTNIGTERWLNGFNTCLKCGYKWQDGVKQPEPTPAEMLLWLLKHANFRIEAYELGFYIKGEWGEQWCGFDTFSHSEKEAIKAAYLKANKRERDGVNDYQERMKQWAEAQNWSLIRKVFTIDGEHKEYSLGINGIGFVVSDFHNFEKELIDLIAKYRI